MAYEGTTFYYKSKQFFNFEKNNFYLKNKQLLTEHPETKQIEGISSPDDICETDIKEIHNMLYQQKKNLGINLWLDSNRYIFWSFVQQDNYFFQNFGFSSLTDVLTDRVSKILIELAINEMMELNENFLAFTIDQYGVTDYHDEFDNFIVVQQEQLKFHDAPDIMFLPKEKTNQINTDDKFLISELNQKFICVAKNSELFNYAKNLILPNQ